MAVQQQQDSPFGLQRVEDYYFSAQFDDDQGDHVPISDDKYALELQLQETLMSSVIASQNTIKGSSSSSTPPPPPPQQPSIPILRFSSPPPSTSPPVLRFSSPPVLRFTSSSTPPPSPPIFSFSASSTSPPILGFPSSSTATPSPSPTSPPILGFRSSSTTTPSPTSPPILGFPSSSTTPPPPSPPIFRFSSSPPPPPSPPVFRFTSSSQPPILRFPSSATSSSSRAVKVKHATKTELIELVDDEQEPGESHVICEICAENKGCDQMFRIKGCDHSFCSDCIIKQVATKIPERITVVPCPGLNCKGVLELDACRPLLPKDLLG